MASSLRLLPVEQASDAEVLSLIGTSFTGVRRDVEALGARTGHGAIAEEVAADMTRRWEGLAPSVGGTTAPPARVFFLEWPDPPWFGGHWVPEQIAAAGAVPVMGEPGAPSRRTTWDDVAAADPDVVVAGACGFGVRENVSHARSLLEHPVAGSLRAVREGRLWAVDSNSFFSRPAPRIVDGAELLASLLADRDPDPRRAVRVTPKV